MEFEKLDETPYRFEVIPLEENERLDKYITSKVKQKTRSQIQFLILNAQIKVNNLVEKNPAKKVKVGDRIDIKIINKSSDLKPYNYQLDIVYEDDDLMVINKPSGLTVHPGSNTNDETLANALIYYSKRLSSISGDNRPGIVHRLDKDTSGLMLVAKNNDAHLHLCGQILERKVKRKYLALVYGVPNPIIGRITTKIAPCKKDRTKMQVVRDENAKTAITNYRVLDAYENNMFSLVECELETGRTHQIRAHMKFKNNPIVGDQKYSVYYNFNPEFVSSCLSDRIKGLYRQALHAYNISFFHPKTLKPMEFKIPMDSSIQDIIDLLITNKNWSQSS